MTAIATYSDLKTALIDWAVEDDAPWGTLIKMAEEEIKPLAKHYRSLKDVTLEIVDNKVTFPDDILELRFVEIDNRKTKELSLFGGVIDASEAAYERVGTSVTVHGEGTLNSIRIVYWSKFNSLSDAENTNWVLTHFPNVYMNATLLKYYQRFKDADQVALFTQSLSNSLAVMEADNISWSKSGTSYDFR